MSYFKVFLTPATRQPRTGHRIPASDWSAGAVLGCDWSPGRALLRARSAGPRLQLYWNLTSPPPPPNYSSSYPIYPPPAPAPASFILLSGHRSLHSQPGCGFLGVRTHVTLIIFSQFSELSIFGSGSLCLWSIPTLPR